MATPRIDEAGLPVTPAEKNRMGWLIWFFLIVILALGLRLYQLDTESLWIDEGYSIRDATNDFNVAKASKPIYYGILSIWIRFGDSDWFLRLPAVIFGTVSVALIFFIGMKIWGNKAGILAALLAAISPMQVDHSQEIRMYTLLMLTTLGSVYFFLLVMRRWDYKHVLASASCLWLAILTHPVACLLFLSQAVTAVEIGLRKRSSMKHWILIAILVIAAWVPWIPHVMGFNRRFEQSWASVMDKPSLIEIPLLWSSFGVGDWDAGFGVSILHYALYLYTFVIILAMGWFVWTDWRKPETRFTAAWLVLPVLSLFLFSTIKTNAWMTRYLIYTSPALFLLLGAFWAKQKNIIAFALLALILFLVPTGKLVRHYQKTTRPEWKQVVQYVMQQEQPTDMIAVYRRGNEYVFKHYYNGHANWLPLGPKHFLKNELLGWNEQKALDLIKSIPAAPRKWLLVSMLPKDSVESIDKALRIHYRVIKAQSYTGIKLYLFQDKTSTQHLGNEGEQVIASDTIKHKNSFSITHKE